MNLKPTPLKIVISIAAFIIVDLVLAASITCFDGCPPWYHFTIEPELLMISFVAFLVVYFLWSFIEKK